MNADDGKLLVKYSATEIGDRVADLAARIDHEYADKRLTLVAILKGAAFFLADLCRRLSTPHSFEFINVARREAGGNESIEIDFSTPLSLAGRHVIVLKDVVNTGVIETYLMNQLRSEEPETLRFAAIVDRPQERRSSILVDYALFSSHDDDLLVGYGMERGGRHGHLPYIAAIGTATARREQ
jgi:hypoxanthine phosphoribosyltransferase